VAPSVAARKQFKAPQIAPKISMKTASMNQDDCCQASPISESLSPFSHFSLTPEDPKAFGAKRSSSLGDADFHVEMLEPDLLVSIFNTSSMLNLSKARVGF
jgi:hypothetical protein